MTQLLGWIATIIFSIMYIPQMYKMLKVNSIKELSLSMFVLGFVANVIALIYAVRINQFPLEVKYTISLIVLAACLGTYYRIWRNNAISIK